MTGRKTTAVSRNCARLNSTVEIGRMARGKKTLFRRPPLSTMAPVAIMVALAKKLHGRRPSMRKKTKPSVRIRRM
jgi:hypothetical protein